MAALLHFSFINTYFSGTMLLSAVLKSVKSILSLFFKISKNGLFMYFLFKTYLQPILYKNNSSVSRKNVRDVNRYLKILIYETNIFYIFNDFKNSLTIFNSFVDYNFAFSYSFKFYATCSENPVITECILTRYTELITVLLKL